MPVEFCYHRVTAKNEKKIVVFFRPKKGFRWKNLGKTRRFNFCTKSMVPLWVGWKKRVRKKTFLFESNFDEKTKNFFIGVGVTVIASMLIFSLFNWKENLRLVSMKILEISLITNRRSVLNRTLITKIFFDVVLKKKIFIFFSLKRKLTNRRSDQPKQHIDRETSHCNRHIRS